MAPPHSTDDGEVAERRGPRRFGRRRWLAASAGVAALPAVAAVDGFLLTPRRLETTFHTLGDPSANGAIRIVQVSDLHIKAFGDFEERVLDTVIALRPDVVVHTGDMLESSRGIRPLQEFLDRCPGATSVAIPGNWEHGSGVPLRELGGLCGRLGIEWLVNRCVVIEHGATALAITGLDDLRAGSPDPFNAGARGAAAPNHLVLAHCPAQRDRLRSSPLARAGLVLSGHTHGGQVSPLGMPLVLPSGSGRYVAGWYREDLGDRLPPLYVSRGLGTSVLPVRLGSRPEIAVFDWHLA